MLKILTFTWYFSLNSNILLSSGISLDISNLRKEVKEKKKSDCRLEWHYSVIIDIYKKKKSACIVFLEAVIPETFPKFMLHKHL